MSATIKINTELSFENGIQIVELAFTATKVIYGESAKPNRLKILSSIAPAIAGTSTLFLAGVVDDQSGKAVGFTAGYAAPMMVEEGMSAVSFLTYVDPGYAAGGWGEKLVLAFEDWAKTKWMAVDIRMELINPENNEAAARIAESHGWKRQGIVMLKRTGGV